MSMKPQEFKEKLKGVVHLALTPFDKNGDLDEKSLRLGIRNITENKDLKGQDIVFLAMGTTGEFYAMNDIENRRAVDIITEEVNGAFPLMIGTGRAGTRYSIEVSKYAEAAGADAVMIVPPYYTMPTIDGVIRHYEEIAGALNIGVCIYNNPSTSKMWLTAKDLKRLSKVDNIVGLKENTSNPMAFLNIMQTLDPKDISIFAGLGHFMYQFMSLHGCTGYVTELLNYAPHLALDLYKAGQAKNVKKVREVTDKIMLFWNWVFALADKYPGIPSVLTPAQTPNDMPYYQAANKAATELCGIPCGVARAPMSNLTDEEKKELRGILIKMGCKVV